MPCGTFSLKLAVHDHLQGMKHTYVVSSAEKWCTEAARQRQGTTVWQEL